MSPAASNKWEKNMKLLIVILVVMAISNQLQAEEARVPARTQADFAPLALHQAAAEMALSGQPLDLPCLPRGR